MSRFQMNYFGVKRAVIQRTYDYENRGESIVAKGNVTLKRKNDHERDVEFEVEEKRAIYFGGQGRVIVENSVYKFQRVAYVYKGGERLTAPPPKEPDVKGAPELKSTSNEEDATTCTVEIQELDTSSTSDADVLEIDTECMNDLERAAIINKTKSKSQRRRERRYAQKAIIDRDLERTAAEIKELKLKLQDAYSQIRRLQYDKERSWCHKCQSREQYITGRSNSRYNEARDRICDYGHAYSDIRDGRHREDHSPRRYSPYTSRGPIDSRRPLHSRHRDELQSTTSRPPRERRSRA
jgi:hypothetical protein